MAGAGEWTHNFVLCIPDDRWWIATFNAFTTELNDKQVSKGHHPILFELQDQRIVGELPIASLLHGKSQSRLASTRVSAERDRSKRPDGSCCVECLLS